MFASGSGELGSLDRTDIFQEDVFKYVDVSTFPCVTFALYVFKSN